MEPRSGVTTVLERNAARITRFPRTPFAAPLLAAPLLAGLLLTVACGGLARDPAGSDDPSADLPPPYPGSSPNDPLPTPQPTSNPPPTVAPSGPDVAPPIGAMTTILPCSGSSSIDLRAMNLSTEWNSIGLRSASNQQGIRSLEEGDVQGRHCGGARDTPTCLEELDEAWPERGGEWTECGGSCRNMGIVMTNGDEVRLYDSLEELRSLLGRIDTASEAALWARINGFGALCDHTIFARPSDGSYLLAVGDPPRDCGQQTSTIYLRVTAGGSIIEQRRENYTNTPGCPDTIR